MKKITIRFFLAIFICASLMSCKPQPKKSYSYISQNIEAPFDLKFAKNSINFIAFKTSDKIPVEGQFSKLTIISGGSGNNIKEAIHNTEFSIPVSSLLTKDSSRDYKIKKFFFGMMEKTDLISGKLTISNKSNGIATIKMNGKSQTVPFTYTLVGNTFNLKATIDVHKWNATAALASLNKVCEDLHKGADGVSVTWSEVELKISSTFN